MRGQRDEGHGLGRARGDIIVHKLDVFLATRRARFARNGLLQNDHVDIRIFLHRVDAGAIGVGALQNAETAIDGIGDQRSHAQNLVELFDGPRRERGKRQAIAFRGVEQQTAIGARQRDRAEPRAARRAGMGEQFAKLHRVIECVGADDAGLGRDRVEGGDRARERTRMRERRLATLLRLPELDRDDRLASRARVLAGGDEFINVGDGLDVNEDHFQRLVAGEIGDVVGDAQTRLVAAGNEVARAHAAFLQRLIDENHHAAALANERHLARRHVLPTILGERHETRGLANIAHAVRAGNADARPRDGLAQLLAERRASLVERLAKAGGKHRRAARARRRARGDRLRHAGRGNNN